MLNRRSWMQTAGKVYPCLGQRAWLLFCSYSAGVEGCVAKCLCISSKHWPVLLSGIYSFQFQWFTCWEAPIPNVFQNISCLFLFSSKLWVKPLTSFFLCAWAISCVTVYSNRTPAERSCAKRHCSRDEALIFSRETRKIHLLPTHS